MNIKTNSEFEHELIDEADIKDKGFVFGETGDVNLPNVNDILSSITEILESLCDDNIQKLKEQNFQEFEQFMETKFPDFSFKYFAIFQKLIKGEDISMLLNMLAEIDRVNKGEDTIENIEKRLGEQLKEKYVHKIDDKGKKNKKKR